MRWILLTIAVPSPKQRELFATFFLNMAVASFAVAAFEGKWWGIIPGFIFVLCAIFLSKRL